jgi:Secretion system C-terminal sorting domain
MKKTYFMGLIFSALSLSSFAQTYDTTTFYGKMGWLYTNLSKTPITTGLLREYGIDFESPDLYTGQFLNDTNYANLDVWRALYQTLFSEQITTTANLSSLDSINKTINSYTSFSLPISFAELYYNYQAFDSSAVANNLLTISGGQLHDVAGRTQSPYKNHYVFCMAPTRQTVFMGSNQMILQSQLFYSNVSKTISTIQVDPLGTGTYQTVYMNTAFTVNYSDTGIYTINIKITYSDGSTNVAHTKVIVYYQDPGGLVMNERKGNKYMGMGPPPPKNLLPYADDTYDGPTTIQARKAYMGQIGSADYTIVYSKYNTSGYVRKPLIVVDGFDPEAVNNNSGQTYWQYYYWAMTYDGNDSINFYNPIPLNGFSGEGFDDGDSLDIVYLHWPNSTDYIERNAYVLESLIQMVDSIKAAHGVTTKNVVLGFSMGGLVARYALRDMEQNGIDHQTRIFIGQDVPYWGANVPVGMQLMTQHLSPWEITNGLFTLGYHQMFPELYGLDTLFFTPAAKEMLIQRYVLSSSGITGITPVTYSISADNSTHTNFLNELSAMGWPVNCRNVTFSNGTCNGTPVFSGNNKLMINVGGGTTYSGGFFYLAQLIGSYIVGYEGGVVSGRIDNWTIPANPFTLLNQMFVAPLTTRATVNLNFSVYSIPNSGSGTIYSGKISISRQLFFGLLNETTNLINYSQSSVSGMLPLDNAPGGYYDIKEFGFDLTAINDSLHSDIGNWVNLVAPEASFCFVPTVSALAVANPTLYLDSSICETVSCMIPSALYDYYSPSVNQAHATYTTDNSNWILKELGWGYACTMVCPTGLSIAGDSLFCTTSDPFYVTSLPANTAINWTVTPSNEAGVTYPTKDTTTLTKFGSDLITLTASFNNSCGVVPVGPLTKSIRVGPPNDTTGELLFNTQGVSNALLQGCNDLQTLYSPGQYSGYVTIDDSVATGYTWYLEGKSSGANVQLIDDPTGQNVQILIKPVPDYADYEVHVYNACGGYTNYYEFQANTACSGGGGTDVVTVSPNPASNTVNIGLNVAPTATTSDGADIADAVSKTAQPLTAGQAASITRVLIYNAGGKRVQDVSFSAGQQLVSVDIKKLPTGTYFVEVVNSNQLVSTGKFVVER